MLNELRKIRYGLSRRSGFRSLPQNHRPAKGLGRATESMWKSWPTTTLRLR